MTTDRFGSTASDTCGPVRQPAPIAVSPRDSIREAVERHAMQLRAALAGGPLVPTTAAPIRVPAVNVHISGSVQKMDAATVEALAECVRAARGTHPLFDAGDITWPPARFSLDEVPAVTPADREEEAENVMGECVFRHCESYGWTTEDDDSPHHCTPACSQAVRDHERASLEARRDFWLKVQARLQWASLIALGFTLAWVLLP